MAPAILVGAGAGAGAGADDVIIFEGHFSWGAAWCMMLWVSCFLACMALMVLSVKGSAFMIISEELSFVKTSNPPYGPEDQPSVDATMREINQLFRFYLPQTALFYSLAASALGLFTVSYFTSFMFLEDIGSKRVMDIGAVIAKGVRAYLSMIIPSIFVILFFGAWYVGVTAGTGALSCFCAGALFNLISARTGVSVTVHGQTRLAHAMSHELFDSMQLGIRTGSIGGLLATSLGLGGMAGMWLIIRDTMSLSGFGSGASIVSFYLRVGGGIFSKGADIGADFVGELEEHRNEEDERLFQLQQTMAKLEEQRAKQRKGLESAEAEAADMLEKLRLMEEDMRDIASHLHPIDYLGCVGENINDVSGTCADLFESMVLILSTSSIIGAKGSAVPHANSGLPFWIVASGSIGSAVVAYYCHVHEHFTSNKIRWMLRSNLICVVIFVQLVQVCISFLEFLNGTIDFRRFIHFTSISIVGQLAPEISVMFCEYFTSGDYSPVRSLALNADLGIVQVVIQGFAQGFSSTFAPAVMMIGCTLLTYRLEGHYGLALLSASSVSGTGFQGGIASFGAIATNAHKIVHLTTYHSLTRHRANVCAAVGDATSHAGNVVSAINAFSAVFNVAMTLLAQAYMNLDQDYLQVTGSILSNFSQAGLVTGVVMTFLFCANTMLNCLDTARAFDHFVRTRKDASRIIKLPFPQSHMKPLKTITRYGTLVAMRMVFNPIINTLACPMVGGFLLGIKGLLFLISGSNVLVLCFSIFLINSGQSWVSARKFILFGLLRRPDGEVVGPDSVHYANLGVGQSIGGPFEDTTGPAMNNFIKFVAVFAFVTGGPGALYDVTPENTWFFGILSIAGSVLLIVMSKYGLTLMVRLIAELAKRRQRAKAFEEGEVIGAAEEEGEDSDGDDAFFD